MDELSERAILEKKYGHDPPWEEFATLLPSPRLAGHGELLSAPSTRSGDVVAMATATALGIGIVVACRCVGWGRGRAREGEWGSVGR